MLVFDPNDRTITSTSGGYSNEGLPIRDTFVQFTSGLQIQRGILYEPVTPCEKSKIGIIIIHSNSDYSTWDICAELAKRGYRTVGGQVTDPNGSMDAKILDIKRVVEFMRSYPGIEKVVLLGHSGGATLMTAYQCAAENGPQVFQGDEKLIKCSITEPLSPADALMALDANWGNGAMTLTSVDPAVVQDGNDIKLDPELDIFSPANGFDPEGANYSDAFIDKYCKAQAERNNKIVKYALERLHALEAGKSFFVDDEPLVIPGAALFGPCNKLFPQDLRLLSRTKGKYDLLHGDGTVTNGIIRSVRRPMFTKTMTTSIFSTLRTTVRNFLRENAVIALPNYRIREDGIEGIDWTRGYNCPTSCIKGVSVPLLCMGMTAGYEFLASELLYENATTKDKTVAFVSGANHVFQTCTECEAFPGQFGDTQKTLCDYVDRWLAEKLMD